MEATRNLCAQIPISLHDRVRQEREALGQSLSEYVSQILKEHFEGGKVTMAATKTLAFQIPEELDLRIKNYLAAEKERTGKKVSQREFIVGLIEQTLPPCSIHTEPMAAGRKRGKTAHSQWKAAATGHRPGMSGRQKNNGAAPVFRRPLPAVDTGTHYPELGTVGEKLRKRGRGNPR